MNLRSSLSFRLALFYVALFAGSVMVLAGAQYWISIHTPLREAETEISREAKRLANVYIIDGQAKLLGQLTSRARTAAHRKAFHAFIDADGDVISSNLPSWPRDVQAGWTRIEADLYRDGDEADHEALVLDRRFDDGARLIVGRDIEDIDEREETLQSAAAWIIGLTVLLGIIGGALMSRIIGQRIDAVTRAARQVIEGDMSGRVPVRGSGDDFDRLGETLNLMLNRIEELLQSVQRVSDNVAHELRTPLARLRANLDDLENASESERGVLLEQASSEAARLAQTFDAVLRIARIEGGRHVAMITEIDVDALLADAAELYQPAAEARSQQLVIGAPSKLKIAGDPDLIFQGVCNLLDNAIKYAPECARIDLLATLTADRPAIEVVDNGPGIATDDRDKVLERFYRLAPTDDISGTGLGLTFVNAVAAVHGASLQLLDAKPGLHVIWTFPAGCRTV